MTFRVFWLLMYCRTYLPKVDTALVDSLSNNIINGDTLELPDELIE